MSANRLIRAGREPQAATFAFPMQTVRIGTMPTLRRQPWWYKKDDWLEHLVMNARGLVGALAALAPAWYFDYQYDVASAWPIPFQVWVFAWSTFGLLAVLGIILAPLAMWFRRRDLKRGWYRQYWPDEGKKG